MLTDHVYVALGSNLGDSAVILLQAWKRIGGNEQVDLLALSPPFLTSPVDMISQHWFVNAVGRLATSLSAGELLDLLLETEQSFGRARGRSRAGYQDRTLDLDLLYFGSEIIDSPRLNLPHPRRADRLFVLAPMAVISPEFVDPELSLTIGQMHRELLARIANNPLASQEIEVGSWPEVNGENR